MVLFFFRYFGHGIHEIDRIGKIVKLKRALDMLFLQLPLRDLFHALFQVACFDQVSHNGTTSNTRNPFCNRENRRVLFVTPATASGADFASWEACAAAKGREFCAGFLRNRKLPWRSRAPAWKAAANPAALLSLPFPLRQRLRRNGIRSLTADIFLRP